MIEGTEIQYPCAHCGDLLTFRIKGYNDREGPELRLVAESIPETAEHIKSHYVIVETAGEGQALVSTEVAERYRDILPHLNQIGGDRWQE